MERQSGWEFRIVDRFFFAPFSLHVLLHFRSKCDPYHCRFWLTFGLLFCHFWITLEHNVTASRSWALGARCEDYPSCRAHFARRAGTTRRTGHAHFASGRGLPVVFGMQISSGGRGLPVVSGMHFFCQAGTTGLPVIYWTCTFR